MIGMSMRGGTSTKTQTRRGRVCSAVAVLAAVLAASPTAGASTPDHEDYVQTFPQDVNVIVGSTLREPDAGTADDAPLFNDAGATLGLTWGQWRQATASAVAHEIGGPNGPRLDVRLELAGLVPGGIYSVFYITLEPDSENPLCPGVERSLPLPGVHPVRQLPDASSFVAGTDGTASYRGRADAALLDAGTLLYSLIYHWDGGTYHPLPNRGEFLTQGDNCRSSFGDDAMRQLLVIQQGP